MGIAVSRAGHWVRRLVLIVLIGMMLVAWGGYLRHVATQEARLSAQRTLVALQVGFLSAINMHRLDVGTRLRFQLLGPEQLALLHQARHAAPDALPAIRAALAASLQDVYAELRTQGIEQVQFHSPDCTSLLRLHAPQVNGDDLNTTRPGLCQAAAASEPLAGFENGRFGPAYRHVFPIVDAGERLGSIEVAIVFPQIVRDLRALLPESRFLLLLPGKRDAGPRLGPDHVVVEGGPLPVPMARLQEAMPTLAGHLAAGDSFAVPVMLQGEGGTSSAFLAVPYLGSPRRAYVVAFAPDDSLLAFQRSAWVQFLAGAVLLLAVAVLWMRSLSQGQRLRHQFDQLDAITRSMGEGLYVMDQSGDILLVNDVACQILGYGREELLGRQAHALFHSHGGNRHLPLEQCPMYRTMTEHDRFSGEEVFVDHQGRRIPVQVHARALREQGRIRGSVTIFSDISERKAQERHIYALAYHDPLTRLPNRRLFTLRLAQAMAACAPDRLLAVMFVDLDHFKPVNDRLGHAAGDRLLQEVAVRMANGVGEGDVVARTGGDEFVVLLTGLRDGAHALAVGERLLRVIEQPFQLALDQARISASIGMALYPLHAGDAETLLVAADRAMYRAKADGRGCVRMATPAEDGSPAG